MTDAEKQIDAGFVRRNHWGDKFPFSYMSAPGGMKCGLSAKLVIILLGNIGFDGAALVDKMHTS